MRCLLQFVIFSLVSTVFGFVEISFMDGYPRLNNSAYFDYYFACHAEGETLQWIVNNSSISDYSGQSTLGSVLSRSISNCNYITTLLTLIPLPSEMSMFDSVLIISCENSTSLSVVCTNGSTSNVTENSKRGLTTMAENNSTSVNLEHVLNKNLVNSDSSSCTNIFLCGVDNDLMTWQVQGINLFTFTFHDTVGMKRQRLRGATVKQQAILIDTKPYRLVVALFMIDFPLVSITCGYNGNTTGISSMACPTNLGTTEPETMKTTESKTTGSMESESSTVGESSTLASGGGNILPLALGLSAFGVFLVVVVIIIPILLSYLCYKIRSKRTKPEPVPKLISLTSRSVGDTHFSGQKEKPLRENNFNGIKKPKPKKENTNYYPFCERVYFIFINMNENVFNAATTFIIAPDVEGGGDVMTILGDNIYIGMLEHHPVGLVRDETGENCEEILTSAIKDHFPNAKYILNVGVCYSFDSYKNHLADVLISKEIIHVTIKEGGDSIINREKMSVAIKRLFCKDPQKVTGLKVAKNRKANHYAVKFGSSVSIIKNEDITSLLQNVDEVSGYNKVGLQLVNLQKNGIEMPDKRDKNIHVIIINGVTGFKDDNKGQVWDFIASQAAFHYVAAKLKVHQISEEKPLRENNFNGIKIPKPKKENTDYCPFCEHVQFIFIIMNENVFNAATTYITAPDVEGGGDVMTIWGDNIYIGMLERHPVGLVQDETGENCEEMLTSAIKDHFPNAKYILNVAICYSFDPIKTDFADVLVSNKINGAIAKNEEQHITSIEMSSEIKKLFCTDPNKVVGLEVAVGGRRAKHLVVAFASSVDITQNEDTVNILESFDETCGIDKVGQQLLNLQRNGIKISDNNFRKVQVAIINGVTGSLIYNMDRAWDFIAAQAAFHYTANKLKRHSPL